MDIVSKVVGDQPICKHQNPGKQKAYDKSMWLKEMMIYNMTCKVVMIAILNCQMKMAMNHRWCEVFHVFSMGSAGWNFQDGRHVAKVRGEDEEGDTSPCEIPQPSPNSIQINALTHPVPLQVQVSTFVSVCHLWLTHDATVVYENLNSTSRMVWMRQPWQHSSTPMVPEH